jgi:hypothetical protein
MVARLGGPRGDRGVIQFAQFDSTRLNDEIQAIRALNARPPSATQPSSDTQPSSQ